MKGVIAFLCLATVVMGAYNRPGPGKLGLASLEELKQRLAELKTDKADEAIEAAQGDQSPTLRSLETSWPDYGIIEWYNFVGKCELWKVNKDTMGSTTILTGSCPDTLMFAYRLVYIGTASDKAAWATKSNEFFGLFQCLNLFADLEEIENANIQTVMYGANPLIQKCIDTYGSEDTEASKAVAAEKDVVKRNMLQSLLSGVQRKRR